MRAILFAAVLAVLAGCEATGSYGLSGIGESRARFEAAFSAGDAAALAGLFTADAAVLAPNLARIEGRPGIQALWQSFFDAGVTGFALRAVELSALGQDASEVGTFTMTGPDGKGGTATIAGKYIVLWRRQADGSWQLRREIWNNDPAG